MKTGAYSFFYAMRMVCFALVLSTTMARCQPIGGITAQDGISVSGDVQIDSFDSSDPNHCIWQSNALFRANYFNPGTAYGIWSNSLSHVSNSFPSRTADISLFSDSNVIDLIGNIYVAGYVETGPNATESLGINSSVGDLAWCFGPTGNGSGGSTGIEPGHWLQYANLNFSSYPLPNPNAWGLQSTWLNVPTPGSGSVINIGGIWWYTNGVWTDIGGTYYTNTGSGFSIGGTVYSLVITNSPRNNYVYYSIGQLTQNIFVDAQYVVLYLTNGWNYPGTEVFTLNTNADIQIWSSGNITVNGQAVINNRGNYTRAFSVYDVAGTSHPISVNLSGNGLATGYYYLPSSYLSLAGGGNTGDFVGSIICYQFSDPGHVNIHFDDSLGTFLRPQIVQQPTNQIVQAGSNALFNVTANYASPGYQWFFDQSNEISGANSPSLVLTNVQLTNEGIYSVVLSNPGGSVTSSPASLIVYANAAATLSGMFNAASGELQFNVSGVTGLDYTLEGSTNLVDWIPLWTNASPFTFTETNQEAYPQRFYRSVFIQ